MLISTTCIVAGCATATFEAIYGADVIGVPISEIVAERGEPVRTEVSPEGLTTYVYRLHELGTCEMSWQLDATRQISSMTHKDKDCRLGPFGP